MQSSLPDGRRLLDITRLTRHFCRLQSPPLLGDNPVHNHHGREGRRLPSPMPQKTARHKPRRLPFQSLVAILRNMDMQETIDSLRTVLESVIAPGVKELRTRLDGVEKSVQEVGQRVDRLDGRVEHLTERMEEGFARADARIDSVSTRMEQGFARVDARMDEGFARMDSKFDNLAERMDSRLDALMSVIVTTRTYPDAITARLERLEREVQELRKA